MKKSEAAEHQQNFFCRASESGDRRFRACLVLVTSVDVASCNLTGAIFSGAKRLATGRNAGTAHAERRKTRDLRRGLNRLVQDSRLHLPFSVQTLF